MIANHDHRDAAVPPTSPGAGDKENDTTIVGFKERYAIGKTLGAGEFATVKAAVDRRTNEKVPIVHI